MGDGKAGVPIPQDWSGDKWRCVELQWPDSPMWTSILLGLLSMPTRGRFWDERTGRITDAQITGRMVFDHNYPLNSCGGEAIPDQPPLSVILIGDEDESGDCDMGCGCCLRWNNGILEMLVCGAWEPVPGVAGQPPTQSGEDPSDPGVPQPGDDEDVNENVKCRFSWIVANAMWRVHERILDYIDDVIAIPTIGDKVAKDLPEYTLGKYHLSVAAASVITGTVGLDVDLVFGTEATYVPDLASYLEKFMPEKYTLSTIEYNAIATTLLAYSFHEGIEINLGQFLEGDYWRQIFWALGRGTVNDLGASARLLTSNDYQCEERTVELPPEIGAVYFSGALQDVWKPSGAAVPQLTVTPNKAKVTVRLANATETFPYTAQQFQIGIVCTVPITSLTLRHRGRCSTGEWQDTQVPDLTDLKGCTPRVDQQLTFEEVGGSVQDGYIDGKWSWATPAFVQWVGYWDQTHEWRIAPRDIAHPWVIDTPSFEIIAWE